MSNKTISAVLCDHHGSIEELRIGDLPRPEIGPDEVRITTAAVGLNFADLLIIQGKYQYSAPFPFAIGMECAGTISELGAQVSNFGIGDRVMAHPWRSCLAAEVAVPAGLTFSLPASISLETAAGFSLAHGTNYHGLVDRGRLQAGETLLVLGAAGGVGLSAVALGKALGARVIAAASSPEKRQLTLEHGADYAIDYQADSLRDAVMALTEGKGVQVVYDPVGGDITKQAMRCLGPGGRLLIIGFAAGEIAEIASNHALIKMVEIVGVNYTRFCEAEPARARANMAAGVHLILSGRIRPHVSAVFEFQDYAAGLKLLAERQVRGRVVVRGPNS